MKIYTKKGDEGSTTNILGEKYSKSDIFMELQGSIDEINAHVGVLRCKIIKVEVNEATYIGSLLKTIQYDLYKIGAELSNNFTKAFINEDNLKFLEENIDKMTETMPLLKKFLYYSGVEEAVYCHVVRTVTRRCERVFARLIESRETKEYGACYKYINRLSDFFFTLARYINFVCGVEEEIVLL
ncbi:cob(I)yrinic acid a,c-diamide adenosyltransferase [Clostridium thermarum]|uniref:cob(I)yrinic acid a,c-diamide adenosyltransferase n=1 Tax=Clostridium thermarum TaxID=1716543 RepID=UPI0011204667|nr:cob(I)yrinic acid a,c-diamide adenosyltransferase [Clostridium thermarum]